MYTAEPTTGEGI